MIYTPLTNRALHIAYEAHADQVDKCGTPYVFHPYHLAEQMSDEISTCVALLHDVVEDTDATLGDLAREFPAEIIDALRLLTHQPGVPYLDYVRALATNPIARSVKRAASDTTWTRRAMRADRSRLQTSSPCGARDTMPRSPSWRKRSRKPLIDHWMPSLSEAHPTARSNPWLHLFSPVKI